MNHDDFVGLVDYLGCEFLHKHGEGLRYCSHKDNSDPCEGNCYFDICPLKNMWLDAEKGLAEYDPFFREEDYDI